MENLLILVKMFFKNFLIMLISERDEVGELINE